MLITQSVAFGDNSWGYSLHRGIDWALRATWTDGACHRNAQQHATGYFACSAPVSANLNMHHPHFILTGQNLSSQNLLRYDFNSRTCETQNCEIPWERVPYLSALEV